MCPFYRNMENLDHIRTQTFDFFFASSSSSFLFNSFWWTCKIKNLSQLLQTKFPWCFMTKKLNNSMQSNLPMWSPLLSGHLYLKVTLVFHGQKVENQAYLLMWSPLLSSHLYLKVTLVFHGQKVENQAYLLMWSLLLSNHLYLKVTFSCPVREDFIWTELLLRGHRYLRPLFLCPNGDLLIQVWLWYIFHLSKCILEVILRCIQCMNLSDTWRDQGNVSGCTVQDVGILRFYFS
jgi:hypothetical protein